MSFEEQQVKRKCHGSGYEQTSGESDNEHPVLIFADKNNGIDVDVFEPKDQTSNSRQSIFRDTGSSTSSLSRNQIHSSYPRTPLTPSKTHPSSHRASPERSPTFPFRPNTALQSYNMTQVRICTSFDEQVQSSTIKKRTMISSSSSDDISVIDESEVVFRDHFPITLNTANDGNWWVSETAEVARQMNPTKKLPKTMDTRCEYIEHIVLPTDTLQGICLAYKVSAMRLKKENSFTGNSLQFAPKKLLIPVNTNYGMHLQRRDKTSEEELSSTSANCKTSVSASNQHSVSNSATESTQHKSALNQFCDDKSHYSKDDMLILEDIMQKLKDEMKGADDMDAEKKGELQQLLQRLESTMSQTDMWKAKDNDTYDNFRKPLVAAAGGTLVTAGAILVPVPVIPGALVIYAGLSVLATEFEVASQALDKMKEPLREILAHEEDSLQKGFHNMEEHTTSWIDLLPITQTLHLHDNDIDQEFKSLIEVTVDQSNNDEFNEAARKTKNEMKRWARNLLNLEPESDTKTGDIFDSQQAVGNNQSVLKRFDSLLSNYGEEVDEKGVASDRGP